MSDHDHDLDLDLSGATPERSASLTLDQIREGGQHLVQVARERLMDVEAALGEGRFSEALERTQELIARLHPLAQAEGFISVFAGSYLVRAEQITEGMVLRHWGEVTGARIEDKPVAGDEPCRHVHLTFRDHDDVEIHATQELVALRAVQE